jgi:hypothetical protein
VHYFSDLVSIHRVLVDPLLLICVRENFKPILEFEGPSGYSNLRTIFRSEDS